MANRSYLYSFDEARTPTHKDLSEWRSFPPLTHLLLVGAAPVPCRSDIWGVEEKIAIRSPAAPARELFEKMIAWLRPQLGESFERDADRALERVCEVDAGTHFHLELGEIFELSGYELAQMEDETRYYCDRARRLTTEVENAIEKNLPADALIELLWELDEVSAESLGFYFPGVLYFHLG